MGQNKDDFFYCKQGLKGACFPGYICSETDGRCVRLECENDRDCPYRHKCKEATSNKNYCTFSECISDAECGEGMMKNRLPYLQIWL